MSALLSALTEALQGSAGLALSGSLLWGAASVLALSPCACTEKASYWTPEGGDASIASTAFNPSSTPAPSDTHRPRCRSILTRIGRNRALLGPYMRAVVWGVNFHYRYHVRRRICPGIV